MPNRQCPPCHGECRQGRDCPADRPDTRIGGHLIVVALTWGTGAWILIGVLATLWRQIP